MFLDVRVWYRTPPKHQGPPENAPLKVVDEHVAEGTETGSEAAVFHSRPEEPMGFGSPHVLVVDDFNNRAGHLPAVRVDPLQQRLQPAHVTLDVGVEESEHLACSAGTAMHV